MKEEIQPIYKYSRTNTTGAIIISGAMIVLGIVASFYYIEPGILAIVLGVGIIIFACYRDKITKKRMTQLESDPQFPILLHDFQEGKQYLGDKLRIGDVFVIAAKTGTITKVSDIQKIYQEVHRTNGIEDRRTLVIVATDDNGLPRAENLCSLKTKGMLKKDAPDDNELKEIMMHMLKLNPNIHLGYK